MGLCLESQSPGRAPAAAVRVPQKFRPKTLHPISSRRILAAQLKLKTNIVDTPQQKNNTTPLSYWLESLSGLFYPRLCLACNKNLPPQQQHLCLSCTYKLPKTDFHLHTENPFTERFWGRIDLKAGAACYHFSKSGRTQQLLHQLKYEGKRGVGVEIGRLYGNVLRDAAAFRGIGLIVPVPLHPRKLHSRGYNQAAMFAKGLSISMGLPWREVLQRRTFTPSQTRKSRMERFENVAQAFALRKGEDLQGKHLLLVDDVITTGATLEACGHCLLQCEGAKLYMATIAIAS